MINLSLLKYKNLKQLNKSKVDPMHWWLAPMHWWLAPVHLNSLKEAAS